jgi:hypothetical protein
VARKLAPSVFYTEERGNEICRLLEEGHSLTSICRRKGMPTFPGVISWCNTNPSFGLQYARAREVQYQRLGDGIFDVSDRSKAGKKVTIEEGFDPKTGQPRTTKTTSTGDMVDRARLMVDTRKWFLSKVLPKVYGDKLQLSSDLDAPAAPLTATQEELRRLSAEDLAALEEHARATEAIMRRAREAAAKEKPPSAEAPEGQASD